MVFNSQITDLLKKKVGLDFDKAKDFDILCADIADKTNRTIGITTLKRLIGYISDSRKANPYTLNTIAIYLGYKSWEELCGSLRIDSDWNFDDPRIFVEDLEIGTRLAIYYLDRYIQLSVQLHNTKKVFSVEKVINSSLKTGDILYIDYLCIGEIIEAKQVIRGTSLGNYKTRGELTRIDYL